MADTKMQKKTSNGEEKKEVVEEVPMGTLRCTYAVTALNQSLMFIYLGFMPFLYKQYGVDPVTYGYIQSTFAFLQLWSSPIMGKLADTFGARQVIIICMLGASAAHLTMGLAGSVAFLVASRALAVVMDAGPASTMLVTDITPEKERAKYLSKSLLPLSIGMIAGPTIGGMLAGYFGSQGALMMTWVLPLLSLFAIVTFIPAQTKKPSSKPAATEGSTEWSRYIRLCTAGSVPLLLLEKALITKKGGVNWARLKELFAVGDIPFLLILRVLATLPGMLFMMNFQLAGVTYFKLTPQGNGMVVSTLGCMNMVNNWFVLPYLNQNVSASKLIRVGPVLSVFVYFFLSQTTEVWQLLCVLYPLNLSYAIMENQVMTRLTKSVDSSDTSTMVGIGTMLFHLSRTLAPTLGGALMMQYGWSAIGSLGFVVSILMASLAFLKH